VGNNESIQLDEKSRQYITDAYVPVGTHSFTVKCASGYKVGDRIAVQRPSTKEWISYIGCDKLSPRWVMDKDRKKVDGTKQWKAAGYTLNFERTITAIADNTITIDAPIVQMMDQKFGGGATFHYEAPNRVTEVGIENIRLVSEFGKPVEGNRYGAPELTRKSELHGWHAIDLLRNTENTWVRNVYSDYFGRTLVKALGKRATIQDCVSLGHASKITGGRRYPFALSGQLNLVQRCLAIEGRHEFVNGARVPGPNAFVDCIGFQTKQFVGPHHRYAVGTLYDNIKSERRMESRFRDNAGTGHGWAGAQTCFYNCISPAIMLGSPPGGISWSIGSGKLVPTPGVKVNPNRPGDYKWVLGTIPSTVKFVGSTGTIEKSDVIRVSPASLYYQQVKDRLGEAAVNRLANEVQRKNMGQFLWVKERLKNESK